MSGILNFRDPVWQTIESAAADLGYELIDLERTQAGLLRVYIDLLDRSRLITVDDCESLSRQLVYQLPVEGIDFSRLEVSSPGFDRRLCKPEHFAQHVGHRVKLKLRMPLSNRRNFEGDLMAAEGKTLKLQFEGVDGSEMVLDFEFDDVEQARLVPIFPTKEKRR